MLSVAIPASAAGVSVSLSGNAAVTAGSSVTYTVNLSGAQKCTGGSVAITVGEKLEVTSGEFLKRVNSQSKCNSRIYDCI